MFIDDIEVTVPSNCLYIDDLICEFGEKMTPSMVNVVSNLGIRKKYIFSDLVSYVYGKKPKIYTSITDEMKRSVVSLMKKNNCEKKDISLLICITNTPNVTYILPSISSSFFPDILNPGTMHLSLSGHGCSALIKAFDIANAWLKSNQGKVIITTSESTTDVLGRNFTKDFPIGTPKEGTKKNISSNWIQSFMFSDTTASILLGSEKNKTSKIKINKMHHITNIDKDDFFDGYVPGNKSTFISADNVDFIMSDRVPDVGGKYIDFLYKSHLEEVKKNIDFWFFHTGSKRILEVICRIVSLQEKSMNTSFEVLENYGNTSATSLSIGLSKIISNNKSGEFSLVGFGMGFSAGVVFGRVF